MVYWAFEDECILMTREGIGPVSVKEFYKNKIKYLCIEQFNWMS